MCSVGAIIGIVQHAMTFLAIYLIIWSFTGKFSFLHIEIFRGDLKYLTK